MRVGVKIQNRLFSEENKLVGYFDTPESENSAHIGKDNPPPPRITKEKIQK